MCDLFRICPIYFINLQSKCPHSLMDRIKDSGSFGRGSNPLGGTGQRHSTSERLFFLLSVLRLVFSSQIFIYLFFNVYYRLQGENRTMTVRRLTGGLPRRTWPPHGLGKWEVPAGYKFSRQRGRRRR